MQTNGKKINLVHQVVLCMGTRPEIIKLAPLYAALKKAGANPVVWHVGQHEELAWPEYEFFGITPDLHLHLVRQKQTLGHLASIILDKLDDVLCEEKVACMVVQGDTSTAFMAALSAFYYKIPIAHVEAGLRTYEMYDPFPEEINRAIISRLAYWHFVPTELARKNLVSEGINESKIYTVGNTIVDATVEGVNRLKKFESTIKSADEFPEKQYIQLKKSCRLIVVTAHRRENWGSGIEQIASSVREAVMKYDDLFVVWPVHVNPLIMRSISRQLESMPEPQRSRIILTKPVDYSIMLRLLNDAWLIMTDSGGIQEEAITLGCPVLVLRETTERQEVIAAGGGVVVGVKQENILAWLERLSSEKELYRQMQDCKNPYGDGKASKYIADIIIKNLDNPG